MYVQPMMLLYLITLFVEAYNLSKEIQYMLRTYLFLYVLTSMVTIECKCVVL